MAIYPSDEPISETIRKKLATPEEAMLKRHFTGYTFAELARADPALAQRIGQELDDKEQA